METLITCVVVTLIFAVFCRTVGAVLRREAMENFEERRGHG